MLVVCNGPYFVNRVIAKARLRLQAEVKTMGFDDGPCSHTGTEFKKHTQEINLNL
jgi:hypothetical protein